MPLLRILLLIDITPDVAAARIANKALAKPAIAELFVIHTPSLLVESMF
jgi:hypothetical protein